MSIQGLNRDIRIQKWRIHDHSTITPRKSTTIFYFTTMSILIPYNKIHF